MYSNAVKEVIAKRQLLRSSSSTFEWLRKVYQVTMEEYLEYETKFLLDLVADQYKGTVTLCFADREDERRINSPFEVRRVRSGLVGDTGRSPGEDRKGQPQCYIMPHGIFSGEPERNKILASASRNGEIQFYSLHPPVPGV